MRKKPLGWTGESEALSWKIIHLQDILIAGLGVCLNKIKLQKYKEFRDKYLPAIEYTSELLTLAAKDLTLLKKGKRGHPPAWFYLGEETVYFGLQTQRAVPVIQKEVRRTKWTKIKTRLEECQEQCKEIQKSIIAAIPEPQTEETYISQRSVNDFLDIVETFEIGHSIAGRWRQHRK